LFKPVLGLIAAFATSLVIAQTPYAPASVPDASPTAVEVDAVLGIIKEKTASAAHTSDFCSLNSSSNLPSQALVVVIRSVPCVSRYGSSYSKDLLEVLYAGERRLVPTDTVFMSSDHVKRLAALEPGQIEASIDQWRLVSLLARKKELERVMAALNATSKYGVALLKASIFDVSEHTEGTGFEATVYNPTKKTIKYVSFTVVGLNAVGDAVTAGIRGGSAPLLRGIGPIGPGESGSYSKDYMWMTDVVQSFRIRSIKLEYMDGSSKVVSDMKKIRLSTQDYEAMTNGDD